MWAYLRYFTLAMEYKNRRSFPLRLPPSMRVQAGMLAERKGISLEQFIILAIDEKLSTLSRKSQKHQSVQGESEKPPHKPHAPNSDTA